MAMASLVFTACYRSAEASLWHPANPPHAPAVLAVGYVPPSLPAWLYGTLLCVYELGFQSECLIMDPFQHYQMEACRDE